MRLFCRGAAESSFRMSLYNATFDSSSAAQPDMPLTASPLSAQIPLDAHWAQGFPPIENPCARVLILGSMPGIASLRAGQYYAHPRNQFWPILGAILGRDLVALSYPERVQCLIDADIALWDVLQSCQRPGSLDADIAPDSIVANDFALFFSQHPALRHIFFNGCAAEQHFNARVRRVLELPGLNVQRLPSTSPAHAALDFLAKLTAWRVVADVIANTAA